MLMSWLAEQLSAVDAGLIQSLDDAAVKSAVVLLITALATMAMRRATAAARHFTWLLGAVSVLLLPLLSIVLPAWYVLPDWISSAAAPTPAAASSARIVPAAPGRAPLESQPVAATPVQLPVAQAVPIRVSFAAWLTLVWLAGCVSYSTVVFLGHVSLWRLQRASKATTDGRLPQLVRELGEQLGLRRSVMLLSSPARTMPMTWGLWRTRLLLPEDATAWTAAELRVVILHELAHARRFDCLTQLVAQLACAMQWFNPFVWLAARQMLWERELACDDLVLLTGAKPTDYAGQLLCMARATSGVRCSVAAIGMARPNQLERRVRAILNPSRARTPLGRQNVMIVSVAVGVAAMVLATLRAEDAVDSPVLQSVRRWAARHDCQAQEIARTTLESPLGLGGAWRNLPFTLDQAEEADAKSCIALARKTRSLFNGKSEFSEPATRIALEDILKRRPGYFYAEFLLASWHRNSGDPLEAARLLDSAYQHAPVIVVQRFALADGSPLADTPIASFALECNRVENHSLDPSLKLLYYDLRTDADGCIYLPVYNTVYRSDDMASPDGYTVNFPKLGWFETSRKVGLLPVATVAASKSN